MNYRMVGRMLAIVLRFVALFMLPAAIISAAMGEMPAFWSFVVTMALMLLLSLLTCALPPRKQTLYAREGFVVVALAWLMLSVLGALPFFFSRAIPNFVDCLFETASGFTTTGASILTDVEALPKGLLYWRSFTHWLGGMGVLVFLLAITPYTSGSGDSLHIMRAESPGPQVSKLVPHTWQSARILYLIYIGMTVLELLLLLLGGMPLFDAVTAAFGTAGTGGFAVLADSIASYSPYLQWVITVFMALFGVNFGIYYLLLHGSFRKALKNEELRVYLAVMLLSSAVIFVNILPGYAGRPLDALRDSCFQVSSIMTTTGFATANFDLWPQLSRALLVGLMIFGACAGSTGGGMKYSRLLILLKSLRLEVRRMLHPNTVSTVRIDGDAVPSEAVNNTYAFLCAYGLIALVSMCVITVDGFSYETNFTAVMACLNNIGPGLGLVGPMGSYAGYSDFSKLVLTGNMLLGRLEIFPLLIIFVPRIWRRARA